MTLKPKTPLDGFSETFGNTLLEEVTGIALVSIATPRGGAEAMQSRIQDVYGIPLPKVGTVVASGDGAMRLLGLQQDQAFALFLHAGDLAVSKIRAGLGDSGYYTDQSDSWAMLRLSGEGTLPALERICPLDLDEAVFPVGTVARTAMEHLGVIILREGTDAFLLLSARSSATNFLHAIEQSVRNVA